MGATGRIIASAGGFSLAYAESLGKNITQAIAARFPVLGGQVIQTNHPSFVMGHLAIYAPRMLTMLEQPVGSLALPPTYDALFKAGVECRDDPDGSLYPPIAEVTESFFRGYRAILALLPEIDDDRLFADNPATGRFRELCPTVGAAVNFLVGGHVMSHLGQVSAWRRCMGLGPAS